MVSPDDIFLQDDLIDATSNSLTHVAKTIIVLIKWSETPLQTHSCISWGSGILKPINTSVVVKVQPPLGSSYRPGTSWHPPSKSLPTSSTLSTTSPKMKCLGRYGRDKFGVYSLVSSVSSTCCAEASPLIIPIVIAIHKVNTLICAPKFVRYSHRHFSKPALPVPEIPAVPVPLLAVVTYDVCLYPDHTLPRLSASMSAWEHEHNAPLVMRALEKSPYVKEVIYPGLVSHPQHELVRWSSLSLHATSHWQSYLGALRVLQCCLLLCSR